MNIEFEKHPELGFRAKGKTELENKLAFWLAGDLQSSEIAVLEILLKINEVERGLIEEWEQTGNGFTIEITKNKVILIGDSVVGEESPEYEYPIKDIKEIVKKWGRFVGAL